MTHREVDILRRATPQLSKGARRRLLKLAAARGKFWRRVLPDLTPQERDRALADTVQFIQTISKEDPHEIHVNGQPHISIE